MSQSRARVLSNLPLPHVDGYPIRTFGDYLPLGQADRPWRPQDERRSLAEILPLIPADEAPDILVFSSPEYLPIPVDVASFPGLKVLLITDWNVCLRFLPDLCPLFDFCFTDWPGFRLLKRAGVPNIRHQPMFGHDPARFHVTGAIRNLDVSFCGNLNAGMHGERNRLLARVALWSRKGRQVNVHLRQAFDQAYVDVLNRSRLVFNYSIRGEANMRLFESMACGAVPLVEESNQEVAILFQEGRHYFRYAPDRLEATLDKLLADPDRLAEVSAAALTVVGGYTKSAQIRSLLDTVCREAPAGPKVPGLEGDLGSMGAAGRKSLIKLRVLGAGYSLTEALQEIQARMPDNPGLELETLPSILVSVLSKHGGEALPAVESMADRYLQATSLPDVLRAFLGMKHALLRKRWKEAMDLADLCLEALSQLEGHPDRIREMYAYFHPPLDLGKGFNTDLNLAFREDLAEGKQRGYLDLLGAHCRADKAEALLSLGRHRESADQLTGPSLERYASLDPYRILFSAQWELGDLEGLRATIRNWWAQKPLDTGVWDKAFEGYARTGDKSVLVAFLETISSMSECFLSEAQSEIIRRLLERERG